MANQTPEQTAAIAAFTQWYHEKQASDAELEAEVARFRAEQKIRRETALNIKGVSVYDALVSTGARKGHMADALGVSRPTLYRILEGLEEAAAMQPKGVTTEDPTPVSGEVLEVRDGLLTIRGVVATHPATIEAGYAVLDFEGVPVKPSGMLATLADEYLPLRWELQHNTALRERVAEEVGKGD